MHQEAPLGVLPVYLLRGYEICDVHEAGCKQCCADAVDESILQRQLGGGDGGDAQQTSGQDRGCSCCCPQGALQHYVPRDQETSHNIMVHGRSCRLVRARGNSAGRDVLMSQVLITGAARLATVPCNPTTNVQCYASLSKHRQQQPPASSIRASVNPKAGGPAPRCNQITCN